MCSISCVRGCHELFKTRNAYNTQVSPDRVTVINKKGKYISEIKHHNSEFMWHCTDGETHTYALLEKPQPQQSTDNSPQLYEVPKKTISKSKKQVSGGLQQQGIPNVMFHHYDDPIKNHLNKSSPPRGNSDPSEHIYALPETQKMTNTVNEYDEPLMESTRTPHSSEEKADPSIHKYAVLEKPQSWVTAIKQL